MCMEFVIANKVFRKALQDSVCTGIIVHIYMPYGFLSVMDIRQYSSSRNPW